MVSILASLSFTKKAIESFPDYFMICWRSAKQIYIFSPGRNVHIINFQEQHALTKEQGISVYIFNLVFL